MEAAFMTGLERNADIVHMATYAPLFAHVEGWQWRPDLIWFDNMRSVKSINYYVQQLYGNHPGTHVLKTLSGKTPLTGQNGLFASSVVDKGKNQMILKIANTNQQAQEVRYTFAGLKAGERTATCIRMTSPDLDWENTLDEPTKVVPVEKDLKISGNSLSMDLPAKSFTVVVINL